MAWHARLSASQTKDWANCPGIIALAEMFPYDDPSGEAAMLGTAAHALIERCLGEGVSTESYAGRLVEILKPNTDDEGTSILRKGAKMPKDVTRKVFEVDDDMVEATEHFCSYVRNRLHELMPAGYPDPDDHAMTKRAVERGHLLLESRVNPLPERNDTGGTADVTIDAWPTCLEVVDYKNGSGVLVPVWENWQLRSYLLGRTHGTDWDYESYRYAIGQPRHYRAPQPDGVSHEDIDAEGLRQFEKTLRIAAQRVDAARECLDSAVTAREMADASGAEGAEGPMPLDEAREVLFRNGFLSVGDDGSHCTYCPHLSSCPAALAKAGEAAVTDFAEDEPGEIEPPMGPNSLAVVLPWTGFLKKFAEAAEKKAEELLLAGTEVPGRKLVMVEGNRALKPDVDPTALQARLAKHYGVADPSKALNPPAPAALRTGPQIKSLVKGKALQEEFEAEFLYRPGGGLKMVDASDRREAVTPQTDAQGDFPDGED